MRAAIPVCIALACWSLATGCQDETPPAWPAGAQLHPAAVGPHQVTLSWPRAQDDEGVTGYRLTVAEKPAVDLPADRTSHTLSDLRDAANHRPTLVALDLAGNASAPLTLDLVTPDGTPPSWRADPPQAEEEQQPILKHEVLEEGKDKVKLRLSWQAAQDNVGVVRYVLKRGGLELGTFEATVLQHELESADPDGTYALVAVDGAGLESKPVNTRVATNFIRKQMIKEITANAGLLKLLGSSSGLSGSGQISNVFGSGSLAVDHDAFGGLVGSDPGYGSGGLGARGTGGGGAGMGGLGTGGLGAYGREREKVPGRVKVLSVEGQGVDGAGFERAVKQRLGAFKACYEKRLKQNPAIRGKIVFDLELDAGRIKAARVADATLEDEGTRACSLRVLKRLRLPDASGRATVSLVYASE